jgi:plastocyanin
MQGSVSVAQYTNFSIAQALKLKGSCMHKARLHLSSMFVVFVLGSILSTSSCIPSSPTEGGGTSSTKTTLHSVTIPHAQDLFEPFILTIEPHTSVTWQNDDTIAHEFTTTPDHNSFLNPQSFSLTVAAGQSFHFTFTQPGLYHYYDRVAATWNTAFSRVAARKGTPRFPLAMDAIIWVRGPISGLPTATLNSVPQDHDEFEHEFMALSSPGAASWHNFDEDPHFFGIVPNWSAPINPVDIGLYRMAGTQDVPGGQSITILFNTPGLYYYYCRNHDRIDAATSRAQALTKASEYPLPMEGFVLVVGS